MAASLLLLLGLLFMKGTAMEECCSEKEVGSIRYILINEQDTSVFGCESDCVYQQEDLPGSMFCFKSGNLPFHCLEGIDDPEWMAVRIIPGGFDNARGHYPEHPIDTSYIHELNNPSTKRKSNPCNLTDKYRSIDGSCNNLNHSNWGATGKYYQRFIPNAYDARPGTPRGGFNPSRLPSPRDISRRFHQQKNDSVPYLSNLFWQFGQYVGHDTGLTPEINLHPKGLLSGGFNNTACAEPKFKKKLTCFNINVTNDPFYKDNKLPTYPWLGFARTLPSNYSKENTTREQVNAGTGFMDASITYGFDLTLSSQLRLNESGLLIYGPDNLLPIINVTAAPANLNLGKNVKNIASGDPRVNVDPWLLSVQTMFFREHNRLAMEISKVSEDDEFIFQNARRILIAQYQNIIFTEFIPLVIGNETMKKYNLSITNTTSDYNESVNPTIYNGFQTAAARFGHSLVQSSMKLQNLGTGKPLNYSLELKNNYFNDTSYYKDNGSGYSEVLGGLSIAKCQHFNRHVTKGLRDYLYDVQGKNDYGDDIASRNIQRGRDHGLPGYMQYRKYCGLSHGVPGDISTTNWDILMKIYGNITDIDLWTGGLAETPAAGAIVGPLFQCLLGKQYHNTKYGDRFFFTHRNQTGSFTTVQQNIIRSRTMRDIICQNSDSPMIRMHAMEIREDEEMINCTERINPLDGGQFLFK